MEPCLNAAWGSGALGEGGVSGVTVEAVDGLELQGGGRGAGGQGGSTGAGRGRNECM